jgi:hypothetical protein
MRGSLYLDRTGIYGGDLIVCTTEGEVWRVSDAGTATPIADVNQHLEGLVVVPDVPVRFGPLAGRILAGAEATGILWVFDADGVDPAFPAGLTLGVSVEDIDVVTPNENFFGVNFGNSRLLGAPASDFLSMRGDVILTQENVAAGSSGLYRLSWDGATFTAQPVPLSASSAAVTPQWEHVTFAAAGIVEIPPVD